VHVQYADLDLNTHIQDIVKRDGFMKTIPSELAGQVAIITGGGRGFGREIAVYMTMLRKNDNELS